MDISLQMKNTFRLLDIIFILYKRGALFLLKDLNVLPNFVIDILSIFAIKSKNLSKPKRVKRILQDLGPFFIKFGQTIATRPDLVGAEMSKELSSLQDRLPTYKDPDIVGYIEAELRMPIHQVFTEFDKTPVATASIAAVFRATDIKGNKVAVKVLKRNVEKDFKKDLKLFFWLAKIIENRSHKTKRLKLVKVVESFKCTTKLEMDMRMEAAAASELKDNHKNDKGIYIPSVYWNSTTKKILVMEWIDGTPIYDLVKLKHSKVDIKQLIQSITTMFLNQAYRDGFFHADLHPGNILIDNRGRIVLIDFGITGRLDQDTKIYLAEILRGFLSRDYNHVARIHFKAGYVSSSKCMGEFALACRAIGEPIVGNATNQISIGKLLSHLFSVTRDFEMDVQPQLLLIQKTTVVVEGLAVLLNPNVNMWDIAQPWMEKWANQNLKFDSKIINKIKKIDEFMEQNLKPLIKNISDYHKV